MIDSFSSKDVDVIKEILETNNIKKLNIICWTHPHEDHSIGIDTLIDTYSDKNTEVWIPENIITDDRKVSKSSRLLFEKLKKEISKKTSIYTVCSASDKKDMLYRHNIGNVIHNHNSYEINMYTLAPKSQTMLTEEFLNKYIANEESIVFYLTVGNAYYLFAGDAEDVSLRNIPSKEIPEHIHFLKIPHHGSKSSKLLIDMIVNGSDISSSTVYRIGSSNLPDHDVLSLYSNKSDNLFCTSKSSDENSGDYGVIHCRTDILKEEYEWETLGNAYRVSKFV